VGGVGGLRERQVRVHTPLATPRRCPRDVPPNTKTRLPPSLPPQYSWIQDYVEQLTLCKYRGRPHWGKNFGRTFTSTACPVRNLYGAGFDALLAAQATYDPGKVYEPPLFAAVVARGGPLYDGPGCATQKLCYCVNDGQCAAGWACRPSRAFGEYRACVPAGLKWGRGGR
jgi:hypothetical protein